VADLYAGAGLFTVPLARAVGPNGSVTAVSGTAAPVPMPSAHSERLRCRWSGPRSTPPWSPGWERPTWWCWILPARVAGPAVMRALVALEPPPRRMAYVSCDPASFARDLRVALDAGWVLTSLRRSISSP